MWGLVILFDLFKPLKNANLAAHSKKVTRWAILISLPVTRSGAGLA
jgi:hypothetical protein